MKIVFVNFNEMKNELWKYEYVEPIFFLSKWDHVNLLSLFSKLKYIFFPFISMFMFFFT